METFLLLAKIFGISFTSGINLYATVGIIGLAIRFKLIQNLPHQLDVFANEYVIGTALVLYLCEFIADKIPAFDSVWDGFHTFIRPFAAAMIALMAAGDCPMIVKIIAFLLAGSVALTSHTAKASIRLLANTSPEPFSNSILSISEDIGVFAIVALTLTHPLIAALIVLCLLTLILWQGPKLLRFVIFIIKALAMKINSFLNAGKVVNIEVLPDKYNEYLNTILIESEKVYLTIQTTFKGPIKNSGYLVVSDNRCVLLYKRWFSIEHIEVKFSQITNMTFKIGFLTDKISFSCDNTQISMILFKSNSRSLDDVKNIFKSLGAQLTESNKANCTSLADKHV